MEQRIRPEGNFDGWNGRDVLCHLAVYARVVGAILRATADNREATAVELYGRELTADEQKMTDLDEINAAAQRDTAEAQLARLSAAQLEAPGPIHPPNWHRPHLKEVVTALTDHCAAHMAGASL